ncbi:maleylpyruvate isomerase [Marmoricola sp. URHA0025 HA25]
MTRPHSLGDALAALHQSEQHLLLTVDSLRPDAYAEPSVLPGWSRAHVVAHLALNAEGLAGAVDGAAHDREVPVYESDERRDADIEQLAGAEPAEIRERLFGAGQALRDALDLLDEEQWDGALLRLPGGPRWPLAEVPETRRREVEIHHADLDAGYGPGDWPEDFRVALLDLVAADRAADAESPSFAVRATDTVRTWSTGAEQPVVEGRAADLAWWLVGRGLGKGLTCGTAELPRLGPWRRTPVK